MAGGLAPGPWDQVEDQYCIDDGTMCRAPSPLPGVLGSPNQSYANWNTFEQVAPQLIEDYFATLDKHPELNGCGVLIQFEAFEPVLLRPSKHASDLRTYVVNQVTAPATTPTIDKRTHWEKWKGVYLNCGGMVVGGVGIGLSVVAMGPAAPIGWLMAGSYIGTMAGVGQCVMAVRKETDPAYAEYIQTEEGAWVNQYDVALDFISLCDGVTGAMSAISKGLTLLEATKHAKHLSSRKLINSVEKTIRKLEEAEKNQKYLGEVYQSAKGRKMKQFEATDRFGKVMSPSKMKTIMLRKVMSVVVKSIKYDILAEITGSIGAFLAGWSSRSESLLSSESLKYSQDYNNYNPHPWWEIQVTVLQESLLGEEIPFDRPGVRD